MDNIKITLETLYDILRNEKKREDLQRIEETFFIDVVAYVREKKVLLISRQKSDDLFASGERDKLEYELRSIKRILKEIYEKREKKIIDIALNRSRTGSDIIDTSAMLVEEKQFYNQVLVILDYYRGGVLLQLFRGDLPVMSSVQVPAAFAQFEPKLTPEKNAEVESSVKPSAIVTPSVAVPVTKIRFINPMPSFVWKDMKVYGPYDKGEEIEIFSEVAELLVRKKRAEKI
ncbi:MAG: hypothetical protein Q8R37_02745 [Nanoarchaeota archaeon]|nr:hypothetical protein [Nanoarchaeota archaeon]